MNSSDYDTRLKLPLSHKQYQVSFIIISQSFQSHQQILPYLLTCYSYFMQQQRIHFDPKNLFCAAISSLLLQRLAQSQTVSLLSLNHTIRHTHTCLDSSERKTSLSQSLLPSKHTANTTDICPFSGIQTLDPSNQAHADVLLRPDSHRHRPLHFQQSLFTPSREVNFEYFSWNLKTVRSFQKQEIDKLLS